ncbi:MAG: hypothetical protein GF349_03190 [Candidatus Magasanikbacteria bacterium]|nr:hypothetical protein [Candidatus Magasanikbacteria bacterium]
MASKKKTPGGHFVKVFEFVPDEQKSGRILSSVKVGGVYISRLMIEPGVVTGNYYHRDTFLMMYAESGSIKGYFEHVKTKKRTDINILPAKQVIHIPPLVSHATANVGLDSAVLVMFSNKRLRSGDDFEYIIKK